MATNPSDMRHQHEAEAATALLLLSSKRYDLPSLIRQAKVRPRRFRQLKPTEALRSDMARPYFDIMRAWQGEREPLITAYATAKATGDSGTITRQVNASADRVEAQLGQIDQRFANILKRLEQWHRLRWIDRIKSATSLDVAMLTQPADAQQPINAAVTWNAQLAGDVNQQAKHRIATALILGLAAGAPVATVQAQIGDAIAKGKRRGAAIGVDQVNRTSEQMTHARRKAAGLDSWRWRHLDPQQHPRPEHQRRDGEIYGSRRKPPEMPGQLVHCHCWSEPLLTA